MSLSVFNWILVTLSTCSEKILLDPCRVFLEYIEIEQGKKKGSTCMVHILISTLVEHLHVGSIIVHYMYTTDQIGIFLWGIFHSTLLYYGDFPLPYLLELILLEEEVPTELGLPSDLLRLHHHQLTNKRWKKISCWLQSGLITCLPLEKNK